MGYIIVCVLAGIIALLLFSDIGINIDYRDALKIRLCIWGIKLNTVYPAKMGRRKKSNKKQNKSSKKSKEDTERQKKSKNSAENGKRPLTDTLSLIADIIKEVAKPLFSKLKVRFSRIVIKVATDDAAKTAIFYGAVVQACAYLVEVLKEYTDYSVSRRNELRIEPDFTAQTTVASIDITLSVKPVSLIGVGIKAAVTYIKHK